MKRQLLLTSFSIGVLAWGTCQAPAQYSFVNVADTTMPIAPDGGPFTQFHPPSLSDGSVAFLGLYNGFSSTAFVTDSGGTLRIVAHTGSPGPSGPWQSLAFHPHISNGQVLFLGVSGGNHFLVTDTAGTVATIAKTYDTGNPGPFGIWSQLFNAEPAFSAGTAAFVANGNPLAGGAQGIFTRSGGGPFKTIVLGGDPAPDGTFSNFGGYGLAVSGSTVAFRGAYVNSDAVAGLGIFKGSGDVARTITTIALKGQVHPSVGTFDSFSSPAISGDTVAFAALNSSGSAQGIFIGSGGALTPIATTSDPVPGVPGATFSSFFDHGVSISGSTVAFSAIHSSATASGIFVASGGTLSKVIRTGEPLFGSVATDLKIAFDALDPDGTIAFSYTLADYRSGVAIARPPVPITIATSASPPGGGSTTGGGVFSMGASVTVVATANPDYVFLNWTEGGAEVSTLASYTFTASASRTLVANFATCPTITLEPATLPDSAPGATYDQTVTASGGTAPYTYAVTSGALPDGLTLSPGGALSGTPTASGSFTFTITTTDANDCPGSLGYTVQIVALDIVCPAGANVECPATPPAAATDLASFGAQGGNVSGGCAPITVTHVGDAQAGTCPVTITRTYRATDSCGRNAECAQTITVSDTTPPVIGSPGANLTIECPDTPVFTPPTATDACDPAPQIVLDSDVTKPGACPGAYEQTKTWHAVDACGNASGPVSQTIIVKDTIAPVLGAAGANTTIECPAPPVFTPPTATDNCDPSPTVEVVSETSTVICGGSYTRTRTWRAVDACGNPSATTVSQTITVADTTAPTAATPAGDLDRTLERGDASGLAAALDLTPTFTDTCSAPVVTTQISSEKIPDPTCIDAETLVRRWTATDACGNTSAEFVQNILIRDTTPPSITCPANILVTDGPATIVDFAATTTDNADPAPIITYDHPPRSAFPMGRTTITCTARDRCGNESQCTFTVIVTQYGCVAASQQAYIKSWNTGAEDSFGQSVAISEDGNTLVVGAPYEDSSDALNPLDDGAVDSGAAYVFVRSGTVWSQQAYLKASNCGGGDGFGISVVISEETVVIGSTGESSGFSGVQNTAGSTPEQSDNSALGSGAAYVFVRSGTTWSQQAYLKASNTGAGDWFGWSVAISGETVVVGAYVEASNFVGVQNTAGSTPEQSDNSALGSGAVYVFVRDGGTWSQQAYLKASNSGGSDWFGASVAISGETVVVGSPGEASSFSGVQNTAGSTPEQSDNSEFLSGAAYTFVRSGTTWSQQAYIKPSNTDGQDAFGISVAISGNTVVIGSPGERSSFTGVQNTAGSTPEQRDNSTPFAGAAYVFLRSGTTWNQEAYLKASNTEREDIFGYSVALSGETAIVGSHLEDSGFRGVQSTSGITPEQRDNSARNSGAAYVFVRSGANWSQQIYLKASNTEAGDAAGSSGAITFPTRFKSVAVGGGAVAIAASFEDSSFRGVQHTSSTTPEQADNSALNSGATYVFTLATEPCARDDSFPVPADTPLVIPIGALLGNDAHSRGLPIYFSSADAATLRGATITPVGSPVTELHLPTPPTLPPGTEDSFTYRITDGVKEAVGTVRLQTVAMPTPPPNKLGVIPTGPVNRGLTLLFNAPAAGTYTLERKTLAIPGTNSVDGSWSPIATQIPSWPAVVGFTDAALPSGALYRVRSGP